MTCNRKLSDEEQLLFFVNFLKLPVRKKFVCLCRSYVPYHEIVRRMRHHHSSEAKQSITLARMLQLHMPTLMCDHGMTSEKEGICSECELIEQFSELPEPEFALENHKVQFLRQAVLPYAWVQSPISQKPIICFKIYGFQSTLENFLTQHMQQTKSSIH